MTVTAPRPATAPSSASAPSARVVITTLLATAFLVKACGFAYDFLGYSISATHGTTAAGAALTLFGVGWCVGQLASGAMTDRLGARSACTAGLLLAAAVCAGLTVASSLNALMLLAFCLGCTMDVHRPAVSAQINERLTSDGARTRAQGWVYWVSNVGVSLSGGVGGFVAQAQGYRFLFALNAVACVAAALLVRRMLTGRPAAPRAAHAHVTYAQIVADARLRWMVAAAIAATTCAYGLISVLPLVMSADQLSPSAYGTAMLANSAAVLLLSPPLTRLLVGRDDRVRFPIGPVLAASSLILGAAMALAATAAHHRGLRHRGGGHGARGDLLQRRRRCLRRDGRPGRCHRPLPGRPQRRGRDRLAHPTGHRRCPQRGRPPPGGRSAGGQRRPRGPGLCASLPHPAPGSHSGARRAPSPAQVTLRQ
ncbi:MFS transporter [Streptomyces sp. PmtG]